MCFTPSKRCRYNCTTNFLHHSFSKCHPFSPCFSMLFHCSRSKLTTKTAQFTFYNCKPHFTTAQIVISCTLKYALLYAPPYSYSFYVFYVVPYLHYLFLTLSSHFFFASCLYSALQILMSLDIVKDVSRRLACRSNGR